MIWSSRRSASSKVGQGGARLQRSQSNIDGRSWTLGIARPAILAGRAGAGQSHSRRGPGELHGQFLGTALLVFPLCPLRGRPGWGVSSRWVRAGESTCHLLCQGLVHAMPCDGRWRAKPSMQRPVQLNEPQMTCHWRLRAFTLERFLPADRQELYVAKWRRYCNRRATRSPATYRTSSNA